MNDIYFFAVCLLKMFSFEITESHEKILLYSFNVQDMQFFFEVSLFLSVSLLKNVFT